MKHTGYCILALFTFSACSTFKGAMSPYSLAQKNSYTFSDYQIAPKKRAKMEQATIDLDPSHEYSLAELVDIALINNPDTQITWEDARVASAQYGQTLQNYFPQIAAGAIAMREKQPFIGPSVSAIFDTVYEANVNLSYLILDFGQTRATSNAALYTLQSVDLSHTRTIQTTVQTIMNEYYNLIFSQELLIAKEQDVKNAYISFDAASEKLRTGTGDLGDVMQTKTYLLQNQLNYTQQKQSVHTSTTTLTDSLGVAPLESMIVQNFPDITPFNLQNLATLMDIAKMQRPDYQSAMAKVLSNEENVTAMVTQNYPTLTGEVEVGRTIVNGINDKVDFIAELKLNFPLFEGFYVINETRAAKSQLQIAKLQLQQLELEIEREVSNYREDIVLSLEAFSFAKQYVESAETDFRIQISKYKAGTNTIVDVINAQTEVANATAKYIATKRDYFTALANLASAIGTLYRNQTLPQDEL